MIVEKNFANKVKARPVNTGVEITKGHLAVIAQRMAGLVAWFFDAKRAVRYVNTEPSIAGGEKAVKEFGC